jgi:uncharacterized delta-60 repeat protein
MKFFFISCLLLGLFLFQKEAFAQISLTSNFSIGTGASAATNPSVIQADGKIIIGGSFTTFNGANKYRIVRLNTNGTIDNNFNTGGLGFSNNVVALALQSDGKILVGGAFGDYNGTPITRIARLNTDGTLDNTFNVGSGFSDFVSGIIVLSDGKILVCGAFTSYNGTATSRIARLNSNGTLDTSFNTGTGFNDYTYTIVRQPDGKILAGGFFTSFNGTSRNRIARLNADGTLDTGFGIGTGANNYVYAIAVQSDNKILVGGYFTAFNGATSSKIVRLNGDGSIDSSFNIGTGFNDHVLTINIIPLSGRIIVGGHFTSYNAVTANRITILETNGSITTNFSSNIGTGLNDIVYSCRLTSTSQLLIMGAFTSYNGITANRVALLELPVTITPTEKTISDINVKVYPNPTRDIIYVISEDKGLRILNLGMTDVQGKAVQTPQVQKDNLFEINTSTLAKGMYLLKIETDRGFILKKVVKE